MASQEPFGGRTVYQPQQPQQPPPPPFVYPPGGYAAAPKRAVWPTVIGTISCVLAGLGLICGPGAKLVNSYNPQTQEVYRHLPEWFRSFETLSMLIGVVFAVLLLAAGVTLLKRRPAGRTLHLAYGALALVVGVVNIGVVFSAISKASAEMPAPMRAGMIGGAFGGAVGLAYPVFLLVWFLRAAIAAEVDRWREQAAA